MQYRRRVAARAATLAVVATTGLVACGSEPEPITVDGYLDALVEVCEDTTARFAELPPAPEQISVSDFATSASSLLDNEAARVDRLDVPDDDAVDDDHRAFIRNTREQAAAWRTVAEVGNEPTADLNAPTDLIRQLIAGRNDLATEMGAQGCRRDGL